MIPNKEYFKLENETATLIDGNPNYAITETGKVYSMRYNRYLKSRVHQTGYVVVNIDKTPKKLHRLLALNFIPNPNNYPSVDHINRDRTDYRLENLRWITVKNNLMNRGNRFCCEKCGHQQTM